MLTITTIVAAALVVPAAAIAAPPASNLFTVSSHSATLTPNGDAYRLTLTAATGSVTRFADRPQRLAGSESFNAFVKRWAARGFAADPPNANVLVDGRNGGSMVLELSHPHVRNGRLSFHARRVGGDRRLPRRLGETHVFIDDASTQTAHDLTISVTGAASVTLDFGSGITAYAGAGPEAMEWVGGVGGGYLTPTSAKILAAPVINGNGGLVSFGVLASGAVTGTATVTGGGTVTIQLDDETAVPLTSGPFSLS